MPRQLGFREDYYSDLSPKCHNPSAHISRITLAWLCQARLLYLFGNSLHGLLPRFFFFLYQTLDSWLALSFRVFSPPFTHTAFSVSSSRSFFAPSFASLLAFYPPDLPIQWGITSSTGTAGRTRQRRRRVDQNRNRPIKRLIESPSPPPSFVPIIKLEIRTPRFDTLLSLIHHNDASFLVGYCSRVRLFWGIRQLSASY